MTNHLAALKEHIASYYTTDAREEIAWAVAEIEHLTRERDEWAGVAAERNREIANLRSDIAQLRGELSLAEEGLANFAQSAGEPEALHLVCCSKCSDQMRLPYTDASRTSVSLFQAGGWYFSTETGWLCPKDAPQVKSSAPQCDCDKCTAARLAHYRADK